MVKDGCKLDTPCLSAFQWNQSCFWCGSHFFSSTLCVSTLPKATGYSCVGTITTVDVQAPAHTENVEWIRRQRVIWWFWMCTRPKGMHTDSCALTGKSGYGGTYGENVVHDYKVTGNQDNLLVERRTRDRKFESWQERRKNFFSRVNFLCWLLFSVCSTLCYCLKCRWQVTAEHVYTLDPMKPEWAHYAVQA